MIFSTCSVVSMHFCWGRRLCSWRNICLVAKLSLQPRGLPELHITAGACSLPAGPWPPAWAGSVLWCQGARGCPGRRCPSSSPGLFLVASGRFGFLPARWAAPPVPTAAAQLTTLPCSCHLSPPGTICRPVFRQSWGRGEEKAGRSQMGQVGDSSPER